MFVILGNSSKFFDDYLAKNSVDHITIFDISRQHEDSDRFMKPNVYFADMSDLEGLVKLIQGIGKPIDAFLSEYEKYVTLTAKLTKRFNIVGIPENTAHVCTDKVAMRDALNSYDSALSPEYLQINNESELVAFANTHGLPLILKPTNLSKSLYVTKNDTIDDLLHNYRSMVTELKKYAANNPAATKSGVIVEKCMFGSIHTIAGFADAKGDITTIDAICDITSGLDLGWSENFLYSRQIPSRLTASEQAALHETASNAMKALSMKNCVSHVEIMLTPDGPKIIEVGARPGGYRARMFQYANGIDYYDAYLNVSAGRDFTITASKEHATATIEIFPRARGVVIEIENKQSLEALKTLHYLSYRIREGEVAGLPSQGFKSAIIVTLANDNLAAVMKDMHYIDDHVSVVTTSDNS